MTIAGWLHQTNSTVRYLACSAVHCYVKKMIIVVFRLQKKHRLLQADGLICWADGLAGSGIIFCGHNFIASVFWPKERLLRHELFADLVRANGFLQYRRRSVPWHLTNSDLSNSPKNSCRGETQIILSEDRKLLPSFRCSVVVESPQSDRLGILLRCNEMEFRVQYGVLWMLFCRFLQVRIRNMQTSLVDCGEPSRLFHL